MNRLNVTDARCEALFASQLQQSDAPTAQAVVVAIREAVRRLGVHGCAARMAQEFGDHPEAAVGRMRWARQVVGAVFAAPRRRRRRWASRRFGCPRGRWHAPSCAPPDGGDQQPYGASAISRSRGYGHQDH